MNLVLAAIICFALALLLWILAYRLFRKKIWDFFGLTVALGAAIVFLGIGLLILQDTINDWSSQQQTITWPWE